MQGLRHSSLQMNVFDKHLKILSSHRIYQVRYLCQQYDSKKWEYNSFSFQNEDKLYMAYMTL